MANEQNIQAAARQYVDQTVHEWNEFTSLRLYLEYLRRTGTWSDAELRGVSREIEQSLRRGLGIR